MIYDAIVAQKAVSHKQGSLLDYLDSLDALTKVEQLNEELVSSVGDFGEPSEYAEKIHSLIQGNLFHGRSL